MKPSWHRLTLSLLALLIASCATPRHREERDLAPYLTTTDNVAEAKIELRLVNPTRETWCIDSGSWPTQGGQLHFRGNDVWLDIGGTAFHIDDDNVGYCGSECSTKILPGRELSGAIPYAKFHLPDADRRAAKKLVIPLIALVC